MQVCTAPSEARRNPIGSRSGTWNLTNAAPMHPVDRRRWSPSHSKRTLCPLATLCSLSKHIRSCEILTIATSCSTMSQSVAVGLPRLATPVGPVLAGTA